MKAEVYFHLQHRVDLLKRASMLNTCCFMKLPCMFGLLRRAELLQSPVEGLQVLPHLAQSALDPGRLVQDLNAAGERVVADRERALDVGRVSPAEKDVGVIQTPVL